MTVSMSEFFIIRKKVGLFSIEQRVRMVEGALAHLENVEIVTSTQELAVTVARNLGVITLIRGLRNAQDLVYEANMDYFNHQLAPELRRFISTPSLLTRPLVQRVFESCWLFSKISHLMSQRV